MPLSATSNVLYMAQRRRMRGKRLLARAWFLSKCAVVLALGVGLLWSAYTALPLLRDAEYFRVQMVEVSGLTTLTRDEVFYLLGITPETTLWQLDLPRMGARLMRHPYIRTVILHRVFPHTLRVTVQERTPYIALSAENQRMLVDYEGVVLRVYQPEQDPHVPNILLTQPQVLEPGMRVRQHDVQRAFELLQAYRTSPLAATLRVVSIAMQPSGMSIWRFEQHPFDIRVGEDEVPRQLERLSFALRYITQQHLNVRTIDLSYKKRLIITPIVVQEATKHHPRQQKR